MQFRWLCLLESQHHADHTSRAWPRLRERQKYYNFLPSTSRRGAKARGISVWRRSRTMTRTRNIPPRPSWNTCDVSRSFFTLARLPAAWCWRPLLCSSGSEDISGNKVNIKVSVLSMHVIISFSIILSTPTQHRPLMTCQRCSSSLKGCLVSS